MHDLTLLSVISMIFKNLYRILKGIDLCHPYVIILYNRCWIFEFNFFLGIVV